MNKQNIVETVSNTKLDVGLPRPTPTLKCIVTGVVRKCSRTQLLRRVKKTDGDVQKYLSHYISREASKFLREGKSLAETRQLLNSTEITPVSVETITLALSING